MHHAEGAKSFARFFHAASGKRPGSQLNIDTRDTDNVHCLNSVSRALL